MPKRIQRRRTKGWRMPEGAVYVGRPTPWGNPFRVTDNMGTRRQPEYWTAEKCVEMFRFSMCKTDRAGIFTDFEMADVDLNPLRGKDLACWCSLSSPCHADVLLELVNIAPLAAKRGEHEVNDEAFYARGQTALFRTSPYRTEGTEIRQLWIRRRERINGSLDLTPERRRKRSGP